MLNKILYKKNKYSLIYQVVKKGRHLSILFLLFVFSTLMKAQILVSPSIQDTTNSSPSLENVKINTPESILCQFTITATSGANGSVTPAGVTEVEINTNKVYKIAPAAGYRVADVLVDGVSVGAVTSYTFWKVIANHTISASFVANTFTITANAGANGTIAPNGLVVVNYGAGKIFTMTPAAGYRIADVLIDGASVGAVSSYTFTNVTRNHSINVSFVLDAYAIIANAGIHGTIFPDGTTAVMLGGNQIYTMTPAVGYHIANVLVDGASVGAVTSYSFTNVAANHTISVSFAVNAYTIAAITGTNGFVTPAGVSNVSSGDNLTYTMTPDAGYHVADVLVDGVSQGAVASYTFTNIAENHTISASFAINTYTLMAIAGTNGTITPDGVMTVNYGTSQSYTITPSANYHVADVLVDGVSVGAVTSYNFTTIAANHTISASFSIDTYTITAISGANGTVTPTGVTTVNYAGSQSYTIMPLTGYHIADVLVDGVSVGAVTSYSFPHITINHTLSASFTIDTFTITASAGVHGTVFPLGAMIFNYGDSQTFTITPEIAYRIADVLVDGVSIGAVSSHTFTNITANHSISASFDFDAYTISANAGVHGTISPDGITAVVKGNNQSYTMTPDRGYHITDVLLDGSSIGAMTSYSFLNVSRNHTISVAFAIDTFLITASAGVHGTISPDGIRIVNYGDSPIYIIKPDTGYHILDLRVDSVSVEEAELIYTFANVISNHTIMVVFEKDPPPITVEAGSEWTLVSVPRRQSDDSASAVFKNKFGPMFEYNQSTKHYMESPTLKCGRGYWVYYLKPTDVIFGGYEPGPYKISAKAGWILVGSKSNPIEISSLTLSNGATMYGGKYSYNPSTQRYDETTIINPGKSVWIFVDKDCTITIP
jgi:ABC-type transporter MlaC component